ncbi:MAG: 2-octaprenyl-6-methoxyphenyl hydroxylase [Thioalkalispiraceae bacterium]|jgi:2-octaprenyl-6-methoxyphenol hydroxylase
MRDTYFDYDLIIVGGGLVGASLACALGDSKLRIAVIEAAPFVTDTAQNLQPRFDARTVALAQGSQQIFSSMGLWQQIEQLGVAPIKKIHISDRGHAGITRLDSEQEKVEALGYVVEMRVLGKVLTERLASFSNIELLCPARLKSLAFSAASAEVGIEHQGHDKTLRTPLVVAADGGQSMARQLSGVNVFETDYGQHAVIANVAVDAPHHNVAYERFTDSGPMALLPLSPDQENDHVYALVWTVSSKQSEEVAGWDDRTFLQQLQQRFGNRAGHFVKASTRHVYPLKFMQAREHVRPHLAFIGNAAHTLHPVAGQGFNLGLRDVASLAQVLVEASSNNMPLGDLRVLKHYAQWRKRDHWQTSLVTDGLVRLFSSKLPPLMLARNVGLVMMDLCPPLKHVMARHAMGYVGKLSRLARGLPLP